MIDLQTATRMHSRLMALCSTFNEKGIRFRRSERTTRVPKPLDNGSRKVVIHRDLIVCSLLNRLVNTKGAILRLATDGCGDDAYALARVAIENSIVIAWLLEGDWPFKVDTFGMYWEAYRARAVELFAKYFADRPQPRSLDQTDSAIAETLRGPKWARVPRTDDPTSLTPGTFKAMCEDLTPAKEGTQDRSSMLYDLAYFHASAYVHSSPPSVHEISRRFSDRYLVEERPSATLAALALNVSNVSLWFAMKAVNDWLAGGLEAELDEIEQLLRGGNEGSGTAH